MKTDTLCFRDHPQEGLRLVAPPFHDPGERSPDLLRLRELRARLLALNAERHQEEVRLGIAPGMKGAAKKPSALTKPQRKKREDELL